MAKNSGYRSDCTVTTVVKQYVLTKFGYVQMMAVTLYATIFWYNTMYICTASYRK